MANNNDPREVAEIVESAMHQFSEAMYHREQLSIRIGRRTTQIIRFGMFGLSVLVITSYSIHYTKLYEVGGLRRDRYLMD